MTLPVLSVPSFRVPPVVETGGPAIVERFAEFLFADLRNDNTRRAYLTAWRHFSGWLEGHGVVTLATVRPLHVAGYVRACEKSVETATVKLRLAALRRAFDWFVAGGHLPLNPAAAVRGPNHVVRVGKTPVLLPEEARQLLESIAPSTLAGLRDRALISLLIYSFARISAAVGMAVEDYYPQGRRMWVRLQEKGGKHHPLPAHHNLEDALDSYLAATGLRSDPKGPLFRSLTPAKGRPLSHQPLTRQKAWQMIRRRAVAAGIRTAINCHSFRATGITAYLINDGQLETAQCMAAHASPRTTKLYDRRGDQVSLDEVERIRI